jgi:fluoroacetyl-CoA thioesterase
VSRLTQLPPVLATAEMIRLMEYAAFELLQPFYEPGEASVGTAVNVRHTAATPLGMRVRTLARLTGFEGRRYFFEVEAHDEKGEIGKGTHERYLIHIDRFRAGVEEKID